MTWEEARQDAAGYDAVQAGEEKARMSDFDMLKDKLEVLCHLTLFGALPVAVVMGGLFWLLNLVGKWI